MSGWEENPYAPPELPAGEDATNWLGSGSIALQRTASGLSLIYYGICVMLVSVIVGAALLYGRFALNLPTIVMIVPVIGGFTGALLNLAGPCLCLSVPRESGARWLAISTILWQMFSMTLMLTPLWHGFDSPGAVAIVYAVTGPINILLLTLLMLRLAKFIERWDLARRARNLLLANGLGIAAFFVIIVITVAIDERAGVGFLILALVALLLFTTFANLLNDLRKVLASQARAEDRGE